MSQQKNTSQRIIAAANTYHSSETTQKRNQALFQQDQQNLLNEAREKLRQKVLALRKAYEKMAVYYNSKENSKGLAENEILQKKFKLFDTYTNNLCALLNQIDDYLPNWSNANEIVNLTLDIKELNAALDNSCHTTLFYNFANILRQIYPDIWFAFFILGPMDFVSLVIALPLAIMGAFSLPVVLSIIGVALALSVLIPIFAGINEITQQKMGAMPLEFNVNELYKLPKISERIEKIVSPKSSNEDTNSIYQSYKSVFATPEESQNKSGLEKQAKSFLTYNDVDTIRNGMNK